MSFILLIKKPLILLGAFLLVSIVLGSSLNAQEEIKKGYLNHFEFPKILNHDTIIMHTGYSLVYNDKHEQASWAAYVNKPEKVNGSVKRKNRFIEDPLVLSLSSTPKDYYKSGFDRGHLVPAADMCWSERAMEESFYMSNMSPQRPSFNRGIWKKLEISVRNWTLDSDSIYVVVGPVLKDSLHTIGQNQVSVPEEFFKVLLRFKNSSIDGIGFLIKNEKSEKSIFSFAQTIDYIEQRTGLDFFYLFENENQFEADIDIEKWN